MNSALSTVPTAIAGLPTDLFIKSLLRVVPLFLMIKLPSSITFPPSFRVLPALAMTVLLTTRFEADGEVAGGDFLFDISIGVAVAVIVSLFFSAAMQATKFLRPENELEDEDGGPWKEVLDSFTFIILCLLLMSLRVERSLLELLATLKNSSSLGTNLNSVDTWSRLMTQVMVLGIKVSSFGFVLILTKSLFSEIYRRLGGESLRLVFSLSFWIMLLVMSPMVIPAYGKFLNEQLSGFWKSWLGA